MSDDFLAPRLAERLTRAARAAQTLSETLWEALQEELTDPRSERVAELSEQLGEVAAVVASLAHVDARAPELEESAGSRARDPSAQATPAQRTSPGTSTAPGEREPRAGEPRTRETSARESDPPASAAPGEREPRAGEPRAGRATYDEQSRPPVEEPAPPWEPPAIETPPVPAMLIDELAAVESAPSRAETAPAPPRTRTAPPFVGAPPMRPDAGVRPREGDPPRKARPEIEIRDERSAEGPAAWIDSIGRRLERHEQDRSPFAVLLVELVDVERLRDAESAEELARLTGRVEDALARELRPADSLTRERPGRYWLLAPQTDGPAAQVLLERIARAVRSSASHRGTPLEVAVGVAVCPKDGLRASELAAHADVGLYAARAAGRPSIG